MSTDDKIFKTFLLSLVIAHLQLSKSTIQIVVVGDICKIVHAVPDRMPHSIDVDCLQRLYVLKNLLLFGEMPVSEIVHLSSWID